MTPDQIALMIPIVAIVMGVGNKMLKRLLDHQVYLTELKMRQVTRGDDTLRAQIDALRQEVASLRETSTSYDLSLQHLLETVDQRVTHLELKMRTGSQGSTSAADQNIQVGR